MIAHIRRSTLLVMALFALTANALASVFPEAANVFTGTVVTSAPVTVSGLGNVPVTVSNGTYSIGCTSTYVATDSVVSDGQTICVQHQASPFPGTSVSTVLQIGNQSLTFKSTTAASTTSAQVASYYRTILGREADASGQQFWQGEASRLEGLGASLNEAWFAMATAFFTSGEYAAKGVSDAEFVTDLYETFFNRGPDASGLAFWSQQIAAGMPRSIVMLSFQFSPEFGSHTQSIFGNTNARSEANTTMDFYRGLLNRLPDSDGYNFWVQRFRNAQCAGAGQLYAEADAISSAFLNSAEYAARNRSNQQFVEDMYNAFLRRGGELSGVQFWTQELNSKSRDQVRQAFMASTEFAARVNAMIADGCFADSDGPASDFAIADDAAYVLSVGAATPMLQSGATTIAGGFLTKATSLAVPWVSQISSDPRLSGGMILSNCTFGDKINQYCGSVEQTDLANTGNCGPTSLIMAEAFLKGLPLDAETKIPRIRDAVDWFFAKYPEKIPSDLQHWFRYWGDAFSTDDLVRYAEQLGLAASDITGTDSKALRAELEKGRPVIVLVRYQGARNTTDRMQLVGRGHYMLLIGMDDDYAYFNDPGQLPRDAINAGNGRNYGTNRRYRIDSFESAWASKGRQAVSVYCRSCTPPLGVVSASTTLTGAKVGTPYVATISASGGYPPYSWSFFQASSDGSITPLSNIAGLSLGGSGALGSISGVPGSAGIFSFHARVTDNTGSFSDAPVGLTVSSSAVTAIAITTPKQLVTGVSGTAYSLPLTASGGNGAYTWTKVAGSLPAGISLSTHGDLSGTPSVGGTFLFSARVTGSGAPAQIADKDFVLNVSCAPSQVLQAGQCISPPVTCTPPQVFQNGACVTSPPVCVPPQELRNGACVTPTPTCVAPQVVRNGQCVMPAPVISSVIPNPVPGSSSSQLFTLTGTNFAPGASVTLRDVSNSETYANRQIVSQTDTQIVLRPVFGNESANWSVEVINPGSVSSGRFAFTVQAQAITPAITSVSPNPVQGSDAAQPFTIRGSNFTSGATVTLRDLTHGQTFNNRTISSFSATQIVINPNFTNAAATWSVEVINPDGRSTGQFTFTVQATTVAVSPSITSVSPNPVSGSDNAQAFTINGSNFASGANVTLRDLTHGQLFANRTISSFSSTRIVINPNFTNVSATWSVEVINPDGRSSGQFTFTVQAVAVSPSITSVSPNPVSGSNTAQAFTINGSNFVSGANVTLRDVTHSQTFANRTTSSFSSTRIVINPNFTNVSATWSVEVINPDGRSSGQFFFSVLQR